MTAPWIFLTGTSSISTLDCPHSNLHLGFSSHTQTTNTKSL